MIQLELFPLKEVLYMRCEACQGTGTIQVMGLPNDHLWVSPCPECHGTKIVSCCEGSERGGQLPEVDKEDEL